MSFRDTVAALRRWLGVILAGVAMGVVVGWLSAPGATSDNLTFAATHTLLFEPQPGQVYIHVGQFALLATTGAVPNRVATRFGMNRGEVRSAVSAVPDYSVSTIAITGHSREAAGATSLSTVTAEELVAEVAGSNQAAFQAEVDRLTAEVDAARARLAKARTGAGLVGARSDLDSAEGALRQYVSAGLPPLPLRTLELPVAVAARSEGIQALDSKRGRALLLGGFGLLLGVCAAFVIERFDNRIRTKAGAEAAFGAPLVAEVPPIPRSSDGQLLTLTEPSSAFVEAYRSLRTYVALWGPRTGGDDGHRVIVVTSPGAGEGKTTTVAQLAVALAETGRSVVVVSADLRRPRLHHFFDRPSEPGLSDVLRGAPDARRLVDLNLATRIRGVRFVPSGAPVRNPAVLFENLGDHLRDARSLADFVLVDSPPLLVANDALEFAAHADGVLLVARTGRTAIKAAQRSAEMLQHLGIPVVGAVLVAADP